MIAYIYNNRQSICYEGETMTILMLLYAGVIPMVPLMGYDIFKKRGDDIKKLICLALFFLQLIISGAAIYTKFF